MTHHKRKRPKSRRAGCLLCKPHKSEHVRGGKSLYRHRDLKRMVDDMTGTFAIGAGAVGGRLMHPR